MPVCHFLHCVSGKKGVFKSECLSHQNISRGDREQRLRGVIKNDLNKEGKILSICYSTQFITDFQSLLQAFKSACFLVSLSLMVWQDWNYFHWLEEIIGQICPKGLFTLSVINLCECTLQWCSWIKTINPYRAIHIVCDQSQCGKASFFFPNQCANETSCAIRLSFRSRSQRCCFCKTSALGTLRSTAKTHCKEKPLMLHRTQVRAEAFAKSVSPISYFCSLNAVWFFFSFEA